MQLHTPQHYLIKTKGNLAYLFYLNKDRTIAARLFSEDNQAQDEEILTPKGILDFSVTIDANDYIHLICINKDGVLLYYIQQKSQWSHRQISKLDIKSNYYKNLLILIKNKETHIFCNKTNLTNPMVTSIEHMYWDNKNINRKTISNYLPGKYPTPQLIDFDSHGNVHLVYKVLYKNNHQLYYNFFNTFNKRWSSAEMITSLQEDHSHPHMLIDNKDNLHLVWCAIQENNFIVRYKRKINVTNYKSRWSGTKTISNPNSNSLSPILIQDGTILKVMAKQTNQIVEIHSSNYGNDWSAPSTQRVHKTSNPVLVSYLTNNDYEKISVSINQCYCEIGDEIKMIGTKLFKPSAIESSSITPSPLQSGPSLNESSEKQEEEVQKETGEPEQTVKPSLEASSVTSAEAPKEESRPEEIEEKKEIKANEPALEIDSNLKDLVEGVQKYINQIILEVERLEATGPQYPITTDNEDVEKPKIHSFYTELTDLNQELMEIENYQLQLQKELNDYQKRIYEIEDRMVFFKKHAIEIQDQVKNINTLTPNFMSRIRNLFK